MAKGPIFQEKDVIVDEGLLKQLSEAVDGLEIAMKATRPIYRGNSSGKTLIGYGVDKSQRSIAADSVISIAKAIKALKGWE